MRFNGRLEFSGADKILRNRGVKPFGRVQRHIDSEVLRTCDPYVPKRSSDLKKSGTRSTVIGSGEVSYDTPYARKQYYENAGRGTDGTAKGGLRGKLFFERAMIDHKDEILDGAIKLSGGRHG